MSVSRFPNADLKTVEEMVDLFDKMVPKPHPIVEDAVNLSHAAFMCAMFEWIISMPTLAQHHHLDPALLAAIKHKLDSCR